MINLMTMWILLSAFCAAMVISPDPLGKAPNGERPLDLAKEATIESFQYASEAARQTGESIKRTVTSATQIPGKAAQTVQRKAEEAAQVIKDGSQAGLEKIGLAQPGKPSNLDVLKSRIQDSEEKLAALKDAAAESARNVQHELEDTVREYTGTVKPPPPTRYEMAKGKMADAYEAGKDTAGEKVDAVMDTTENAAGAVKGTVIGTGTRIENGAHALYKSAEDKASETSDFVENLARKIVESVEEDIGAAKSGTHEASKSAYEAAADGLRQTATKAKRLAGIKDKSPPSYQERIQEATEQAADILRSRGAAAASVLPNIGQGLAFGGLDTEEKKSVGDYVSQAGEWMGVTGTSQPEPRLKTRVERYVDAMKSKIVGSPAPTTSGDWREDFLNKLGIHSEKDLSKKDILVGKFNGFTSGGIFHKMGEAFDSTVAATQDAAHSAEQMASDTASKTKATVVDGVKSAQGNLTRRTSGEDEEQSSKKRRATLLQKVSWITTAWVMSVFRTAHLFAFASVYGTSLWITFVSGYVLSRSVSRQQFGFVQSRVFPTYLKLIASGQLVCLVSYIGLHPWSDANRSEKFEYLFLWGTLLTTLLNTFILEPQATKLMFEKLKIEKDEGLHHHHGHDVVMDDDDEAKARLTKINSTFHVLHGYSSFANLLGLLGMTMHLWHLSGSMSI